MAILVAALTVILVTKIVNQYSVGWAQVLARLCFFARIWTRVLRLLKFKKRKVTRFAKSRYIFRGLQKLYG
jgi:hypothetical protein